MKSANEEKKQEVHCKKYIFWYNNWQLGWQFITVKLRVIKPKVCSNIPSYK